MIRNSPLLKWAQNNKTSRTSNRAWIHSPEALQHGHVAYLVKFLGNTEVEQAKGIEVVKEGIRKLKFNQQLKRAEGAKIPKVELTISVDGVAIQEPKTKRSFHQYPLHRISYCADDKSDKKFFSFIAKDAEGDKHSCFVFVSDKLSQEITLTIGQAFDLAYRRFLESSGKDLEMRKQLMLFQKRVQELELENANLLKKLSAYQQCSKNGGFVDLTFVNGTTTPVDKGLPSIAPPPPVPPRFFEHPSPSTAELLENVTFHERPAVGRKLENLLIDDVEDFDPRGEIVNGRKNGHATRDERDAAGNDTEKDLFGAEPFVPPSPDGQTTTDPFGMSDFNDAKDLESAIGAIDKKLSEMRDGFSRGLSFGVDDFSLETLDPLNQPN